MMRLIEIVRTIVEPFTMGQYVPDWQARAARAAAISDYYTIRHRDNPLFQFDDEDLGVGFGSRAILRQCLADSFEAAFAEQTISYAFPMHELDAEARAAFESHYGYVDSVEKMAMSAIAYAICHLKPSLQQLLLLCGQFYEEGLHLHSMSTLLGIDQTQRSWIEPKREPFWRFARSCDSLAEYVLFQNCLSEGEGAIAAAEIVFALGSLPEGSPAVGVSRRIMAEETSHALLGYTVLRQLDNGLDEEWVTRALTRYQSVECVRPADSPKGRRQRFALDLLQLYMSTRDVSRVERHLLGAVANCRASGTWLSERARARG